MPEIYYRNPDTGVLFTRSETPDSRPDWVPSIRYPDECSIDSIEGAVPGTSGYVRVLYKSKQATHWDSTTWMIVDQQRDFTRQILLTELTPDTEYDMLVESKDEEMISTGKRIQGNFRTAPMPDQPSDVVFTVSTGQAYGDQDIPGEGWKIYPAMLQLKPSFFIHTGDIVYYDSRAKNISLARWHWARTYSLPTNREFHRQVASYFIKDDHDTWRNDCWPGMQSEFMGEFTFEQGQKVFLEQVPMRCSRTYRTYKWGEDLQIWLVEGRDYRSPNTIPDGPEKTIWGKVQKEWFKRTVQESEATFRILISPTPLVGPDRKNKRDNHANQAFTHEGNELREFIAAQQDMVVICGDRHWQYVSIDLETGVREYSCGPASNAHAGGWSNDKVMPEHQYLNVTGGFLSVSVHRENGNPTLTLRHHDVEGRILNEDTVIDL